MQAVAGVPRAAHILNSVLWYLKRNASSISGTETFTIHQDWRSQVVYIRMDPSVVLVLKATILDTVILSLHFKRPLYLFIYLLLLFFLRSLVGCSPWGRLGSNTTERLHFHFFFFLILFYFKRPLQFSQETTQHSWEEKHQDYPTYTACLQLNQDLLFLFLFISLFCCSGLSCGMQDLLWWHVNSWLCPVVVLFPDQESNLGCLHWEFRDLTTEPPGKSQGSIPLQWVFEGPYSYSRGFVLENIRRVRRESRMRTKSWKAFYPRQLSWV